MTQRGDGKVWGGGVPDFVRIISPDNKDYLIEGVSPVFARHVQSHCMEAFLGEHIGEFGNSPIFLVICGEPGTGKTYQSIASCIAAGLTVMYCSASFLTGQYVGDSAQAITDVYEAARTLRKINRRSVILLDDFHMSEAAVTNGVSTTINSSLLTGRLMDLCSDPSSVRVPIIVTANSLSGVDPALLRDGRSRLIDWSPTEVDRRLAARMILRELDEYEFTRFYQLHSSQTPAFFDAAMREARRIQVEHAIVGNPGALSFDAIKESFSMGVPPVDASLLELAALYLGRSDG